MTATLHRIGAGDGFRYYTAMVASGDAARGKGESLGDYYTRSGNPPGVWMGRGLAALGVAGEVREDQLGRLLGLGLHPETGEALGSPYRLYATVDERIAARLAELAAPDAAVEAAIREDESSKGERQAVAGFDSTFSPVKSVSVAWALAEPDVAAEIEAAHDAAVESTLAWIEREVLTARTGRDGVGHVDVSGAIVAAFKHRTSRAGDPDLHTHVVISNKVEAILPDGTRKWLTLDSRSLYKANVSFSERYNRVLEDELHARLGWQFAVRSDQKATAVSPIRELAIIPEPLIHAFSQRRQQIEADYLQRVQEYRAQHRREPTKAVQYQLAQAATLANRPRKEHTSEADERDLWRSVAEGQLDEAELHQLLTDLAGSEHAEPGQLSDEEVREYARAAVADLQERRADWTDRHLLSVALRLTADTHFATSEARDATMQAIVDEAHILDESVRVSAHEVVQTPDQYRRRDGSALWDAPASERYTTTAILDAEDRLVRSAREAIEGRVPPESLALVLSDHTLARDQHAVIERIATGARRTQLVIGPAGTGKTTTMRGLVDVWQRLAGGAVRGLAPTAAAASVLRTETGMNAATTIDYWATLRRLGDERARFSPGEMIIVDEAGMAGTLNLDRVVEAARQDGAQVVLVGDPHQLAAIASGGALRLIQNEVGAAELNTVWRFSDRDATGKRVIRQWEADASLQLRVGNERAISAYLEHERVHSGARDVQTNSIYAAWLEDRDQGMDSVMIASDNATVQALSDRARTDRIAAGQVHGPPLTLRNGSQASCGDIIVTRKNNRELRVGADFVKNGDLWAIARVGEDGSLLVEGTHGSAVLPAEYVAAHVELGYAMTAHRAQGLTVDTSHVLVETTMSREVLYVAATRGRTANHLYAVTDHLMDVELERPADPDYPAQVVLETVLRRSDAAVAATESIREEHRRAISVRTHLERWTFVQDARGSGESVLDAVVDEDVAARIREDRAWPYLRHMLEWNSPADAQARLQQAVAERSLAGADSPASVLAARLGARRAERSRGDWLPDLSGDDYQDRLVARMRDRAAELGESAATEQPEWAASLGPVPTDPIERAEWVRRAGLIAAYREAYEVESPRAPLGPEPRDPAQREQWERAATALPQDTEQQHRDGNARYAALSVQQLRQLQDELTRKRDRARRAARPGPSEGAMVAAAIKQHEDRVTQWQHTVARVDQALEAEQALEVAEAAARQAAIEDAQHRSALPPQRGRQQWAQTAGNLSQVAQRADQFARDAGERAVEAARGLPGDRDAWQPLRAHAQAALAQADDQRARAIEDARQQYAALLARRDRASQDLEATTTDLTAVDRALQNRAAEQRQTHAISRDDPARDAPTEHQK